MNSRQVVHQQAADASALDGIGRFQCFRTPPTSFRPDHLPRCVQVKKKNTRRFPRHQATDRAEILRWILQSRSTVSNIPLLADSFRNELNIETQIRRTCHVLLSLSVNSRLFRWKYCRTATPQPKGILSTNVRTAVVLKKRRKNSASITFLTVRQCNR